MKNPYKLVSDAHDIQSKKVLLEFIHVKLNITIFLNNMENKPYQQKTSKNFSEELSIE